jgi:hypothetical protein
LSKLMIRLDQIYSSSESIPASHDYHMSGGIDFSGLNEELFKEINPNNSMHISSNLFNSSS